MVVGLIIILMLVLVLPFFVKQVEHNLEIFLFIMGLAATIVSKVLSGHLILEIFSNHNLYLITGAVLVAGLIFKALKSKVKNGVDAILKHMPLKVFIFIVIIVLGLASSFITAIIASLLLVEIVNVLPISRKDKITLSVVACFSIGLGAVLTPVGEPLATIVISKLHKDFWFLFREVGVYIVAGCIAMGILGAFIVGRGKVSKEALDNNVEDDDNEGLSEVFIRTGKIFLFIFALELLGTGFKPLIDKYVINLNDIVLYFINTISAVLDNATLAAAEISPSMHPDQVQSILMGLLISGGMLIPGNIPNIISAQKLKISSKEWAKRGLPIGAVVLLVYFIILFVI